MKQIISIDQDTVLELCVRPREAADGEDTEDTAGFAADGPGLAASRLPIPQLPDPLQGYRVAVVPIPHHGPPVEAPGQDVWGFGTNDQESQSASSEQQAASDPAVHLTLPDPTPADTQDAQGFLLVLVPRLAGASVAGQGAASAHDSPLSASYKGYEEPTDQEKSVFEASDHPGKP